MSDSSNPTSPNFIPGVGRLVTDRYDFQSHVDGASFRHNATQIDLFPTLVISGNTVSNTQDAITALANIIAPPSLPLATDTTPGLVQLSSAGDIHGSAINMKVTGLRGYPINTASPAVNNVLTWNGTAWGPAVSQGLFTAGGDLSGNNVSQQVFGLTGDTTTHPGFRTIKASNDYIQFTSTTVPIITQDVNSTNTSASAMTIAAQSSSGSIRNGGNLILASGAASGEESGGIPGTLSLAIDSPPANGGRCFFQGTQLNFQLISGFFPSDSTNITVTDMPANSGNKVIYIGNASSAPTTPSPTGSILYSNSGALYVMQSDGTNFNIAYASNLANSGSTGTVNFLGTLTNPQLGQTSTNVTSATGKKLVIIAQNATGTTSIGGDLALSSGTGTSSNGTLRIQNGTVDVATFDLNKFVNLRGLRRNYRSSSISTSLFALDDIVELTSNGLTATLPASPTTGDKHTISCTLSAGSTFATNGNGKNIYYAGASSSSPLTITISSSTPSAISFVYNGTLWVAAAGF